MICMVKDYINIPLRTETLFIDIIDDLVDNKKYKNRTDFINKAIEEKIKNEGISLEPREIKIYGSNWEL